MQLELHRIAPVRAANVLALLYAFSMVLFAVPAFVTLLGSSRATPVGPTAAQVGALDLSVVFARLSRPWPRIRLGRRPGRCESLQLHRPPRWRSSARFPDDATNLLTLPLTENRPQGSADPLLRRRPTQSYRPVRKTASGGTANGARSGDTHSARARADMSRSRDQNRKRTDLSPRGLSTRTSTRSSSATAGSNEARKASIRRT